MSKFMDYISETAGSFVHKCEAQYHEKTITFYVKEISGAEANKIYGPAQTGTEAEKNKHIQIIPHMLLHVMIVEEDGSPSFASREEAGQVPVTLANILRDHALRINGLDKTDEAKDDDAKKE